MSNNLPRDINSVAISKPNPCRSTGNLDRSYVPRLQASLMESKIESMDGFTFFLDGSFDELLGLRTKSHAITKESKFIFLIEIPYLTWNHRLISWSTRYPRRNSFDLIEFASFSKLHFVIYDHCPPNWGIDWSLIYAKPCLSCHSWYLVVAADSSRLLHRRLSVAGDSTSIGSFYHRIRLWLWEADCIM